MATTPIKSTYELTTDESWLAVRGLEALRASVARAVKAEHDAEVAKLRNGELNKIDALIARFR